MEKDRLVVLTGAGGKIGRALISRIIERTRWCILAFSSSLETKEEWGQRVRVHHNSEICTLLPSLKDADTCVHMAFSRRFNTNSDIALSLDFSSNLYKAAVACGCRLVNLSTVGVYGLNPDFPTEEAVPAPDSLYSMAKYASEVLMHSYYMNTDISATNVRLSGIVQSQRVLPIFIENAKTKGEIQITGGKQQFSWIDIDDAVDALIALIAYDGVWKPAYNVSLNKERYLITDCAEYVAEAAEEKGYGRTRVVVTPTDDNPICVGWNAEAFMDDTGWKPNVTIQETINKMF